MDFASSSVFLKASSVLIEGIARGRQFDQIGGGIEVNIELVAGGTLELRTEFRQHAPERTAREHLQLGGVKLTRG
jgi:hypothetical protein